MRTRKCFLTFQGIIIITTRNFLVCGVNCVAFGIVREREDKVVLYYFFFLLLQLANCWQLLSILANFSANVFLLANSRI